MTQWIETYDQTLVDASAVEAVKPVSRTEKLATRHEVLLMTANHSYVFANGFGSRDAAVKVARLLAGKIGTGPNGRKFTLDPATNTVNTRFID